MKINRQSKKKLQKQLEKWKDTDEAGGSGEVESEPESFQETVDKNTLETLDMEVQDLVEELDNRGDALVEHPTVTHVRQYQQVLASFLEKSLELSKEITRVRGRRNLEDLREGNDQKEHVIVKTIDEAVDELSEEIIQSQKEEIDIAGRVGDLQGLVVDLVSQLEDRNPEKNTTP
ncbi:MAG: YaaR family protein [bacterium]